MTVPVRDSRTLTKRITMALTSMILALLALVLAMLCSCSPTTTSESTASGTNSAASDNTTPAATVSGEENLETSTALVAGVRGDQVLLIDQETQTPYFPTSPTAVVTDLAGNTITFADLVPGNVVEVVGDNIMLESYPGQYPGITSITVAAEGSPADAAPYADLVQQVMPEPGNSVPGGYVEYADDLGQVSVLLSPYAYSWQTDGDDQPSTASDSFFDDNGILSTEMGDARIEKATEATLGFDDKAQSVSMERIPLTSDESDAFAVDPAAQDEAVSVNEASGSYSFTMEPGYAYVVRASFENGNAEYAFVAIQR